MGRLQSDQVISRDESLHDGPSWPLDSESDCLTTTDFDARPDRPASEPDGTELARPRAVLSGHATSFGLLGATSVTHIEQLRPGFALEHGELLRGEAQRAPTLAHVVVGYFDGGMHSPIRHWRVPLSLIFCGRLQPGDDVIGIDLLARPVVRVGVDR